MNGNVLTYEGDKEGQVIDDDYAIYLGDSCELIKTIPESSVDMSIYSPPFEGLYKFTF